MTSQDTLPRELREIVKWSVALLGQVIEKEAGPRLYALIEALRRDMADLREQDDAATLVTLRACLKRLRNLKPRDREVVARSFTLMLELMNACENAHRSRRLAEKLPATEAEPKPEGPEAIFYVLTAHPTEARSPQNIGVFREIQRSLAEALSGEVPRSRLEHRLFHWLEMAWRVSIVRDRAPKVRDEAEHIYSVLLQEDVLQSLLQASEEIVPVYIRTWVGGDKDGHPGVDEKAMRESLALSRRYLLRFVDQRIDILRQALSLLPVGTLRRELADLSRALTPLRKMSDGDAGRVQKLRTTLTRLNQRYENVVGVTHPQLRRLRQLLHLFPGLVVPLELRESSDVLLSSPKPGTKLAIDRMLRSLAKLAGRHDPRCYARGFIVSMASECEHLRVADAKVRAAFGRTSLPVIPLLEQKSALQRGPEIVRAMLRDKHLGRDIRKSWGGKLEVMVGYSDSAKESGVLSSRWEIAQAMHRLDSACVAEGVKPLFFQGSGGSVDRGGGSVQEQTSWWPHSALRMYKVTIQGEMVERSLAGPEITRGQIESIAKSVRGALSCEPSVPNSPSVDAFAARASKAYREMIADPAFLRMVEKATPYPRLNALKIGSRPTSRRKQLSVDGLRAIPWVLCWTQTRVLFQTWWGLGSAWRSSDATERRALRRAFDTEPVFRSFANALGFTLAKVQLPTWRIYLDQSGLAEHEALLYYQRFQVELEGAREFLAFISGHKEPLWFRPWLAASIRLRSPMIHPLNLLQVLAMEDGDEQLLRLTVTGISSGMLTTG